jgi:Tfp pilus assembly protein FimT
MKVSVQHKSNTITYIVLGIAFLGLFGTALFAFSSAHESRQATEKAGQLQSELTAAGFTAPPTDQIVNVLGDDGGAVCQDPASALSRATLNAQLTNGAAGPGQRPVIADKRVVQGQALIIKVYCPEYIEEFQQVVDDLKFDDVAEA